MLGSQEQDPKQGCSIAEILQYDCPIQTNEKGQLRYTCYPIPRIFRICQGRPAVEITKLVNIDMATGEVDVSNESSQKLPKVKPWRDVLRNAT